MPSSARLAAAHRTAAAQSFRPAGNGCGPSLPAELRNSTPTTTTPVAARYSRSGMYPVSAALSDRHAAAMQMHHAGNARRCRGSADVQRDVVAVATGDRGFVVVTPSVISGQPCANTSKIAPMPSSLIAAKASRSSNGESTVSAISRCLPSSPNSRERLDHSRVGAGIGAECGVGIGVTSVWHGATVQCCGGAQPPIREHGSRDSAQSWC